ncbi:MAG: glycosyltransferase family 2 protein [Alphaproteobacteria bacterium]|jgi:glycosyltransferase involved in cell wall biosynthesis|nr:glycosyltransferase family 2 protein [Candidatus Jidaibacter sp.]
MKKNRKNLLNKLPISVFIISKNEEDRISYTINSVKSWVDEVVLIDSGSTDNTVEVAKKSGATDVIYNKWTGYGPQKVFGESVCKNEWLLNLDADEEISEQLKDNIIALFQSKKYLKKSAYYLTVKFKPRFSEFSPNTPGPEVDVIRLYNKTKAGFKDSPVHDSVVVKEGLVDALKGKIIHRCFRSFTHAVDKINFYTSAQAEDMIARGKKASILRIAVEPFWTFFKCYIGNKQIFLGAEGFMMSIVYAFARTLRLIKAKEKMMEMNQK